MDLVFVTTLTFDLMTFNVCTASAVTWQTNVPILEKPKYPRRISPEAFFVRGLARTYTCGAYSSLLDPLAEFKLLVSSVLAPGRAVVASRLKISAITAPATIKKFKDRLRALGYTPLT